jgi:ribosome-binding protein aMBF1 (putative translation factor)
MSRLTSEQIKMARAALDWSIDVLAEKTDVSSRTIKRIEAQVGIPVATEANLRLIRETLQAAGIEFIGDAGEGPGVRLWKKSNQS